MFHEKELSQLLELNAYKIPLGALGGGRGAVATRHFGAAIAHYARRMRLPGAMLTVHRLHGRANRIQPSDGVVSRRCFAVWLTVGLVHQQRRRPRPRLQADRSAALRHADFAPSRPSHFMKSPLAIVLKVQALKRRVHAEWLIHG